MKHPLEDMSATIMVVEPMIARRSMVIEGFRAIGFKRMQWAGSLKDAIGVIAGEATPPDWILTPLLAEASINALQFLARLLANKAHRQCRVSLILEEDQSYCLNAAFALGLYSFHERFSHTQGQMAAVAEILPIGAQCDWDDCLTSAHYLRQHLMATNAYVALERLEIRLLALYPERAAQVLSLAEALMLAGNVGGAQLVLDRLPELTPEQTHQAKALSAVVQAALLKSPAAISGIAEMLELERAVVVDPDESARNVIVKALQSLGVTAIDEYVDGEAAWAAMKAANQAPNIIVQEWRLPKLSGDMLVQRARLNGFAGVPIVVYSSLVKARDRLLLREMGVTEVLEKPMSADRLTASLIAILKEEQRPTTTLGIERQVRACLANRDDGGARRHLARLGDGRTGGENVKLALEAEFEYQHGQLGRAADLATRALTLGGDDVLVLNLLGKINLKLGAAKAAARFFDRAQKLSPQNVGRLLFLAEAQVGTDDHEAAQVTLSRAKTLDAGNLRVTEAAAKIALAAGDADGARGLIAGIGATTGIAAFVNNRAVALVAQGRTGESIELYRSALAALPVKARNVRAIINYNLALGLLRLGELGAASACLTDAPLPTAPAVMAKVRSLKARTAQALATGEPMQLFLGSSEAPTELRTDEADDAAAAAPSVEAGTLRCHVVYTDDAPDPRTAKLLDTGTGYRAGKTIRKGRPA